MYIRLAFACMRYNLVPRIGGLHHLLHFRTDLNLLKNTFLVSYAALLLPPRNSKNSYIPFDTV
jgi:hypothetical protein